MNAERYVNDILRKVKCTGRKKREIRQQLLTDIAARRQQGEGLEQIMESMGSAEEIAEAFAQELSDAERKACRRERVGIIAGSAVLVLLLFAVFVWWMLPKPADLSGNFSQEVIAGQVEEVIALLEQNDFEALQERSINEMRPLLTQETIDKVRMGISGDWGERQALGTVYAQGISQKGKLIIVTQTDAIYENISVVYTISFDRDLKLAGLYMR